MIFIFSSISHKILYLFYPIPSLPVFGQLQYPNAHISYNFHIKFAFRCKCTHGKLASDGKTCETLLEYLILAKRNEIQFLHLDPFRRSSFPFKTITSLSNAIGIDFDYKKQIIYYSDIFMKEIGSIRVNGTDKTTLVTGEFFHY